MTRLALASTFRSSLLDVEVSEVTPLALEGLGITPISLSGVTELTRLALASTFRSSVLDVEVNEVTPLALEGLSGVTELTRLALAAATLGSLGSRRKVGLPTFAETGSIPALVRGCGVMTRSSREGTVFLDFTSEVVLEDVPTFAVLSRTA